MALSSDPVIFETPAATGPFDSVRDYIAAIEARGSLLRIPDMDQDRYEATAFAYRLVEERGFDEAPPFLIEKLTHRGRQYDLPVLGNLFGGWDNEALAFGVDPDSAEQQGLYRAAFDRLATLYREHDGWPRIEPVEIDAANAPCRQVVVTGDDVDLFEYPWVQTNPGDAGAYITAGTTFVEDPKLGRNVATYRCQVKSKNRLGFNTETGQNAWSFIQAYRRRGEKQMPVAIVIGADPITFSIGTSKLAALGEDELDIAGGLRGKPVELVKCETSDLRVPAHAELVIEGTVATEETEEEGPYGEVYGYIGLKKPKNFFVNVTAITHRRQPWIVNCFAGITKLTMSMPQIVANNVNYKKVIPNLVEFYRPIETIGVAILSIDKRFVGEGMQAAQHIAANDLFAKLVIVVDKDINVRNKAQVYQALGTRWQPSPASLLIPQTRGFPLDPSAPTRWLTSKMIIDATRQLPEEGGPQQWPDVSREIVVKQHPEAFELVARRWASYFGKDRD